MPGNLRIVKCLRCGHSWPTKGEPRVCPKCKSPWWNQPKKQREEK